MEKIKFLDKASCYQLSNGIVEVIVTTDVGPRILSYSIVGGPNILGEIPEDVIHTALGDWKPWGGHRLWAAPEANPRSYWPENDPIGFEVEDDLTIRLQPPVETATGIQKEMVVSMATDSSVVMIEHTITNRGLWDIELAPWAITILRGGGTAIIPQEPYLSWDDYLLPARPMTLWHYTDLSDPRFTFGKKYLRLRTDENADTPQKIGVLNKQGWAAYSLEQTLFLKRFDFSEGFRYPDYQSNNEVYTKGRFIELESLGPLEMLEPGESAVHYERWELHAGVGLPGNDEELDEVLSPIVNTQEPA